MTGPEFYRSRSLWLDGLADDPLTPRPALPGPLEVDVAVVGAGYTGLWTAYYLRRADPGLRVAVLEREIAGFGASGRNGGWCSAFVAMDREGLAAKAGRGAPIALQRAMFDTVDEVGRVVDREGIDCAYRKGGALQVVTSPVQLARLEDGVGHARRWGMGEQDLFLLSRDEAERRVRVAGLLAASFTPHCAAIDPARLVRGLARAVERHGATIYESTPVTRIRPGRADTPHGPVRAEVVVRATEGYGTALPGLRRSLLPLYSLMVATEPLDEAAWKEIGWDGGETMAAGGHLFTYAQRTRDGRIAFGGRGAPYHFGSRIRPGYDRDRAVHGRLKATLAELLPAAGGARITHRWGGPLGIPRDWTSSVGLDRDTGLAWAGGYVGDGVGTANLAGRTLADLIRGEGTDLTRLPWVQHRSRPWEPEPLRWLGVNAVRVLAGSADAAERRSGRPARLRERVLGRFLGD
ncbi:MAG TPA: FAD-dependent oxidoreductase [Actinomycetes bacterium]|nr:FAD-dependent oxidoreductase [Actinomycetes bacterium]